MCVTWGDGAIPSIDIWFYQSRCWWQKPHALRVQMKMHDASGSGLFTCGQTPWNQAALALLHLEGVSLVTDLRVTCIQPLTSSDIDRSSPAQSAVPSRSLTCAQKGLDLRSTEPAKRFQKNKPPRNSAVTKRLGAAPAPDPRLYCRQQMRCARRQCAERRGRCSRRSTRLMSAIRLVSVPTTRRTLCAQTLTKGSGCQNW